MKPEDFIIAYEKALRTQDWKSVEPLFHDNVCVTFSNGSVHIGKPKVKVAFENNFSLIKSEEYSMQNIKWILKTEATAVFLFEFAWSGIINDKHAEGNGIGTSVLINQNGKWTLLTENLSKKASS
ncbi:nuclear transport factor 2 family protein [Croceitalea rosinachiae]|uniref:Nuclear transport factor 2 family protein n=1 Tax=Croceitalea rosinachiae TaxID=3075596 RepID=A0ABU3AE00_9FLAO|nr:nuclear transport factor 2 family protein [Croceitalea sp. F388]MDT0608148.1 nuclear transport factor 2 family protein [Croceitalea sp. F388]